MRSSRRRRKALLDDRVGISNTGTSCPVHEADQVSLIEEMRNNFRPYVEQRRLLGLFYYAWIDPMENFGVFRRAPESTWSA